jgi:UDP-N-acetylglucosamine--N-acetylmuramyl-(pentapeptide) pyrophosphoryl-undecaprenol N-acetylglucosamine transferase
MTSAARSAGVPDAVDRLADLVERQANLAPTGQAHQSAAATTASSARRATA